MRTTFCRKNCSRNQLSYSDLKQRRQFDQIKKNYDLRDKECEYHRDQLETAYEKALERQYFGIDILPASLPKQSTRTITPRDVSPKTHYQPTSSYKTSYQPIPSYKASYQPEYSYKTSCQPSYQTTFQPDFSYKPSQPEYSYKSYYPPEHSYKNSNQPSYQNPIPSSAKNFKSIPPSPYAKNFNVNEYTVSPPTNNYSSEKQYTSNDQKTSYTSSQYSGSKKVSIYNFKIPSPPVDINSHSRINQFNNLNHTHITSAKLSKNISSQTDSFHFDKDPSAIDKFTTKQQPSRMETMDFDNVPRENRVILKDQATNTSVHNVSQHNDDSGFGANPFAFSRVQKSSNQKVQQAHPAKKNESSFEMMPELHASDLESTIGEEEEEDQFVNNLTNNEEEEFTVSNESHHKDESTQIELHYEEEDLAQFAFTDQQEEENQVQINIDTNQNEEEEEIVDDEVFFNLSITEEAKSNGNCNSEMDVNYSYRSNKNKSMANNSDNLELSRKLDAVAQNLQSFSSNVKTGSSSNPHSQMLNDSENDKNASQKKNSIEMLALTPNREIFARRAIEQTNGEFSIAHSASSELSAVVFTQNDSISNSDESNSIDGIPKPLIDSPTKNH